MQTDFEDSPRIIEVSLQEETEKRYLNYALSVITSRALPDVRDGLKPVQRRILYGMHANLKLVPGSKYRKSAAVVGEVMGKYHPHGDQAIYDAMVRMAQPFSLREPLVEGYGNFGSVDGDKAAAMRYTEVRLQPISMHLLDEINQETVDFRDTFDGTLQEPVVLPARFPNLLVNGSTGIAVGMATNIPPHNLQEVLNALQLLLKNPEVTTTQLLGKIKGPDFPTGGELITPKKERIKIYEAGQGNLTVRGEWKEEKVREKKKGQRLIITSIPYSVNKSVLIERIADIILSKKLPGLVDVRDESTEEMRVVLELKAKTNPDLIMAYLYKQTSLQQRFAVNLTCLTPTTNPLVSTPARLSLKQVLEQFLAFRLEVQRRRFLCELKKLRKRIHILEGFRILFNDLDKAIRIIRDSDGRKDAGIKLMKYFKLDQIQVDAVLDTRLYRLARLEINSILEELRKLQTRASEIEFILASKSKMDEILEQEFMEIGKKNPSKRQTKIREKDNTLQFDADDFIQEEDTHVILTKEGWVKRIKTINAIKLIRVREGDKVLSIAASSTKENVCFLSNKGVAYTIKTWDIPATTGYGVPIQSLFKLKDGEFILTTLSLDPRLCGDIGALTKEKISESNIDAPLQIPPNHLLIATASGQGSRISLAPYQEVSNKNGRRFTRLSRGDEVVLVELMNNAPLLILVTKQKRNLMFAAHQVKFLSAAGKGVKLIQLDENDQIFGAALSYKSDQGLHLKTSDGKDIFVIPKGSRSIGKRLTKGKAMRVKAWDKVVFQPPRIPSFHQTKSSSPTTESPQTDAPEIEETDEAKTETQTRFFE